MSIETPPYEGWRDGDALEIVLNFADGKQLVFSTYWSPVHDLFEPDPADEDAVFMVREDEFYVPYSNNSVSLLRSILVDENVIEIHMYFDEAFYESDSTLKQAFVYPSGLFLRTRKRNIDICRNATQGCVLHVNYLDASQSLLFPIEERWMDYKDVTRMWRGG